jgi:hypothetical protein
MGTSDKLDTINNHTIPHRTLECSSYFGERSSTRLLHHKSHARVPILAETEGHLVT